MKFEKNILLHYIDIQVFKIISKNEKSKNDTT